MNDLRLPQGWLNSMGSEEDRTPWSLVAMPQITPQVHKSIWIEEPPRFQRLTKKLKLFEYEHHDVFGFSDPDDPKSRIIAAVDAEGKPLFASNIDRVDIEADDSQLSHALQGLNFWVQNSVAFSDEFARQNLRGLPSEVFWRLMASDGNVAISDGQQTPDAKRFWTRILLGNGADFIVLVVDPSSKGTHYLHATVESGTRWEHYVAAGRSLERLWTEDESGKNIRILVRRRT